MAEHYALLRLIHVSCALLSVSGFAIRSVLLLMGSGLWRKPWVRRITDTNDALLLAAAVGLMVATAQYPFVTPWLTAKFLAVLAYIGLGFAVFRLLKRRDYQIVAVLVAWLMVAYILSAAIKKTPCGFLATWC